MAAFFFDLDGTLLDSTKLIIASFHHTRRVHFGDEIPTEEWISGMGTPLRDVFAAMARSPEECEAMIATYVAHNLEAHDAMVEAFPGATKVVKELKARGHKTALVTSKKRRGAEAGVAFLGLSDTFDAFLSADDVTNGKPHPEPILTALKLTGADPEQTLFIGDSPHDIHAGQAAGVKTAAVSWGPFQPETLKATNPDRWLGSLEELLD